MSSTEDHRHLQHGFIRLRTALIICGALVVGAILILLLTPKDPAKQRASSEPKGYEAAAQQFIKAMSHKDGKTSYNLFTDRYKKDVGSESDWQKQLDQSFKDSSGSPKLASGMKQPDPSNIYKGKDPQRIIYSFDFKGVKWSTTLLVLKDQSLWKIDEVASDFQ